MKGLFVTLVDVLGIFVPGLLFCGSLVAMPPVWRVVQPQISSIGSLASSDRLLGVAIVIVVSYVLGFLNRLWSIRLLQAMFKQYWTSRLEQLASTLNPAFEGLVSDKLLCNSLRLLAKRMGSGDPSYYAPYFHYAKRLIRMTPGLWAEAERLEADVRFTAGLFLPLLIMSIDGVWMALAYHSWTGGVVAFVSGAGAAAAAVGYPARRNHEVVYNYLLALVALRSSKPDYPSAKPNHAAEPAAEDL